MASTLRSSALATRLLDPFEPTAGVHGDAAYRLREGSRPWLIPLLLGVALLAVSFVGLAVDPARFFFAYLVGWMFCVALSLGGLFFVMIHHITRSHWAVVVRRIAEGLAMSFPALLVLGLPIFFGMHSLFHWTHHELYDPASPAFDPILAGKHTFLNTPFFIVRVVLYFAIWSFLAYRLWKLSVQQDVDPTTDIPAKQRKVSAWGIPVFALTTAFASFDLLMSLDPHWFSTIFGVYFFAGSFWSAVAFIAFTGILLQRMGVLRGVVTTEHYHDLGKWMFAFTVFWAYIAFSQYMLIWYANLKEETIWFEHRLTHGWGYHSAALLALHFILPFLILLPRAAKRSTALLAIMAVWFFIMQWFDLHWLALPALSMTHPEAATFSWLDLTCWLGLFGVFVSLFLFRIGRHSLVPVNDPRLPQSLAFQNI